jgi:hypothetical protein
VGRTLLLRPSLRGRSGFDFDERVYSALRAHTADRLDYCAGCFAKWHCAGDCYHKALHWNSDDFAGAGRCEIIRALTKDQILENLAGAGGSSSKSSNSDTRKNSPSEWAGHETAI